MSARAAIRRAGEGDLGALLALRRRFFESQIAAGLLDVPADLEATLAATTPALLTSRRNDVLLAEEGAALGYLHAATRVAPGMRQPRIGSVEEVFVAPEARAAGLARDLVERALEAMRERGAERFQLRVLAGNDGGRAFWRRLGFVENVLILEMPPEAPA